MPLPAGEDVLQDDFGAAILAVIVANTGAGEPFQMIDVSGSEPHAEYGDRHVVYAKGKSGRCLVRPLPERPVAGENHEASALVEFPFVLEFDAVDTRGQTLTKSKLSSAVQTAFGDRGEQMLDEFEDTGENLLPGLPVLRIDAQGDETSLEQGGPDRPRMFAFLTVTAWAKVPRTTLADLP